MHAIRHHLRPATWLALVAMLALVLLPALSHLSQARAAAAGGVDWAEVCTPQGTKLVATAAGDEAPRPDSSVHLEHCPFCAHAAQAAMLPAAAPLARPPALPAHAMPRLFLQAPPTLLAWASAQPRGPPARS